MDFEQILTLVERVSDSRLTSFQYEEGNLKLSMERQPLQVSEGMEECLPGKGTAAMEAGIDGYRIQPEPGEKAGNQPETQGEEKEGNLVKSMLVGTFYAAPSEEAEPFVKAGDRVTKGQVLAIVEAMKLMNEVESDYDGEIAEVFVRNGEAVEYGQPLFRIV